MQRQTRSSALQGQVHRIIGDANIVGQSNVLLAVKAGPGGTLGDVVQVAGDYYAAPIAASLAVAPTPPAHFVGRGAELCTLEQALVVDKKPYAIVAIVGMGGIGKTALATQLAKQLERTLLGGVFWADLPAHNGNPIPILSAWARICGQDVRAISDPRVCADTLRSFLADRVAERGQMLAVLDGVRERWLDEARVLLSACPSGVSILLTTRNEELALALGAIVYRLDVLPLGQAIELLAALVGQVVKREPDDTRWLIERVGRLPMALVLIGKLAALRSRKPGWRLRNLREQLEARSSKLLQLERRRELEVCFSLSYDTLDPHEQHLFRALSVFAFAPFAVEHVAAVLGWEIAGTEVALDRLVALSLLEWEKGEGEGVRYSQQPLLREYATTLLDETSEGETLRSAHIAYYLAYAERLAQSAATDHKALATELPNVQLAMDRVYEGKRWEEVYRFAEALRGFLLVRGLWDELRTRLRQAAYAAEVQGDRTGIARALLGLGMLAYRLGDYSEAWHLCQQGLDTSRGCGDQAGAARALLGLGAISRNTGKYVEARNLYRQARDIFGRIGDQAGAARAMLGLGAISQNTGKYVEARHLYRQARDIFGRFGDQAGVAQASLSLGGVALSMGKYTRAQQLFHESLGIFDGLGDRAQVADALRALGWASCGTGDCVRAQSLCQESLDIAEELGDPERTAGVLEVLSAIAYSRREYLRAQQLCLRSLHISERLGDRMSIATSRRLLGIVILARGDSLGAQDLLQESQIVFRELGARVFLADTLFQLGWVTMVRANYVEARRFFNQSRRVYEELSSEVGIARSRLLLYYTAIIEPMALAALGAVIGSVVGILVALPIVTAVAGSITGPLSRKGVGVYTLSWVVIGAFLGGTVGFTAGDATGLILSAAAGSAVGALLSGMVFQAMALLRALSLVVFKKCFLERRER